MLKIKHKNTATHSSTKKKIKGKKKKKERKVITVNGHFIHLLLFSTLSGEIFWVIK